MRSINLCGFCVSLNNMSLILRYSLVLIAILSIALAGVFLQTRGVAAASCAPGVTGAGGFVPLECFDGSPKLENAYKQKEFGPFLQTVFVGAISLGAILAVLRLAYAGFLYMASDLPSVKGRSKDVIQDTLLGLFLLLAIWLILHQINPDILSLEFRVPDPTTPPI